MISLGPTGGKNGKICGKGMNAARQRLRLDSRVAGVFCGGVCPPELWTLRTLCEADCVLMEMTRRKMVKYTEKRDECSEV